MTNRDAYGTVEIARLLDVSPATAVNWIRAGKLRAWRTPGGHRRVPRAELLRFLRKNKMPVPEELCDQPRRVLVVDDDPGVRRVLLAAFDEIAAKAVPDGIEVRFAEDGIAGLIDVGFFRPDVLVLDIVLPGMDGYEVCRRIRSYPDFRPLILAISGQRSPEVEKRILEAGADAFFPKPLDLEELLRVAMDPFMESSE